MYLGMGMPGGAEWFVIMFVGCFAYVLPILFAVFVMIYLLKIHSTVEAIRKKLDQLEQK
jgi:cobalamin biosynthesis protein CobD/CbiB